MTPEQFKLDPILINVDFSVHVRTLSGRITEVAPSSPFPMSEALFLTGPISSGDGNNGDGTCDGDWNSVEGNWKQLKGKIKEQWGHLTDDDLDKIAGKREQLEGKIQERYGLSKDAARKDIDEWINKQ